MNYFESNIHVSRSPTFFKLHIQNSRNIHLRKKSTFVRKQLLPSVMGEVAHSSMTQGFGQCRLFPAGAEPAQGRAGWTVQHWFSTRGPAAHYVFSSCMCHIANAGVWLGFLIDNFSFMLNFYSPRNTKALKLYYFLRYLICMQTADRRYHLLWICNWHKSGKMT